MEKFRHRKCGNYNDVVNVLKVSNMFKCVFTGCSRVGAKITANDRISVGHGTGWAKGKDVCTILFPSLPFTVRTEHRTRHLCQTCSGRSTGFITITGERHWYKGEASDTTSCRKSL